MGDEPPRRARGPLDFVNPVDLIVEGLGWRLRHAGRQVITGMLLVTALAVTSLGLFVPLIAASVLITMFGLAVEPNKWIGSILIVGALVTGLVSIPLILRRIARRGRSLLAYTTFASDDDVGVATLPTGFAPPPGPRGTTREEWTAAIRALDERIGPAAEVPPPTTP